jgi:serine protease AprX
VERQKGFICKSGKEILNPRQQETESKSLNPSAKISPAFEPFLAESGPNDRREAIVLYRVPEQRPVERGRLRELKERLRAVESQARVQKPIHAGILTRYARSTGVKQPADGLAQATSDMRDSPLPVARVEITAKALPALAEQPEVVAILPNQKICLLKPKIIECQGIAKQEIRSGVTWGLQQLDIPKLWRTTKGKHINIAVLDTGVHGDHPALVGRVEKFVVIDPLGRRITTSATFDSGQHGTHVSGTIAGGKTPEGVSIGVAPEAKLFVAGVLVGDATLSTLIEGISWAVENGANIINMSLGFSYYEPLFDQVFKMLIDQFEVLPVVAIGNENHGNTSSPGNSANALSVGAAEKIRRGKLAVASFSSGATLVFPGEEPHALVTKPDVTAPGVQVYSSTPPEKTPRGTFLYSYMDGTSMATPHVAGVAALLMAARPQVSVRDIIEQLRATAKHPTGSDRRPDNRWGMGFIQPLDALKALG